MRYWDSSALVPLLVRENSSGDVETRLSELHDAFHVLMELASSEHAHGEHHEHGGSAE